MSTLEVMVRRVAVAGAVVVAGGLLLLPPAGGLAPAAGEAQVDGSVLEWGPDDDAAALYGNDRPHAELARLGLRYDCEDEILYALVIASPGVRLLATDPDEAYLRFADEPKLVSGTDVADGDAPDAAWVDLAGDTAAGIEMSAPLAPGTQPDLRVHAKVPNDSADGYQTVDLLPRYQELTVACPDGAVAADVALTTTADPPVDPGAEVAGLARTGSPNVPMLVAAGVALLAAGLVLRARPWVRSRP